MNTILYNTIPGVYLLYSTVYSHFSRTVVTTVVQYINNTASHISLKEFKNIYEIYRNKFILSILKSFQSILFMFVLLLINLQIHSFLMKFLTIS